MQVDPFAGFQFNWGHCYSIYVTCPAGRAVEGAQSQERMLDDGWEGGLPCAHRAGRGEAVSRHQTTRLSKIVRVFSCYR